MKKIFGLIILLSVPYWYFFIRFVPPPPLKISRETTYFTKLIRTKNTIDLAETLNHNLFLKPEHNAAVELLKIKGIQIISSDIAKQNEFVQKLHMGIDFASSAVLFNPTTFIERKGFMGFELSRNRNDFYLKPWLEEECPELVSLIASNQKTFLLMADMGKKKGCFWPYLKNEKMWAACPPRELKPNQPIRLLLARAMNNLAKADYEKTWEDIWVSGRAGYSIIQSNLTLFTLFGLLGVSDSLEATAVLLNQKDISAPVISQISKKLKFFEDLSRCNFSMEHEYRFNPLSLILEDMQPNGSFWQKNATAASDEFNPAVYLDLNRLCIRTNQEADRYRAALRLENIPERIRKIKEFYSNGQNENLLPSWNQLMFDFLKIKFLTLSTQKSAMISDYVIGILLALSRPNHTTIALEALAISERARLLRLAAFVRLQQLETQNTPQTLEKIEVPDPKMLIDSFSEKPFRYILSTETITLYSIGPDLKDDNGKISANTSDCDLVVRLVR